MDEFNNEPKAMAEIMSRLPVAAWAEPKPQSALLSAECYLKPASPLDIAMNLSRCLTLCAPSGMSLDDRTEWIVIAAEAVASIPEGLLADACRHAQTIADHPAKIIPAICAYAEANRDSFIRRNRPAYPPSLRLVEPSKPPALSQADVDRIVAERGLAMSTYRDMGAIVNGPGGSYIPANPKATQ